MFGGLHAVGPFYIDAFRNFYVAWLAQIFTNVWLKKRNFLPDNIT